MRMVSPVKSAMEMRRSAPTSTFVSLPKPFTPVVDCKGVQTFRVCEALTRCDAYQDCIEMAELESEVGSATEEQEDTDEENRSDDIVPVA